MSLNKPATAAGGRRPQWSGTPHWYLWDGGFFAIGRGEGIVPPHAHHAIQIALAIDGDVGIRGKRGDWRTGRGVVVRPDVVHSYNPSGALGAMLFVDPESAEGVWLRSSLRNDITLVPEARLIACADELRRFSSSRSRAWTFATWSGIACTRFARVAAQPSDRRAHHTRARHDSRLG